MDAPENDLTGPISNELYDILVKFGADSGLLSIVGSWRDTMPDEWVLESLRSWNEHAKPPASYSDAVEPYDAALRMVHEAIEELFGPLANMPADEALVTPAERGQAMVEALRRLSEKL
jgi:hypothetical protein